MSQVVEMKLVCDECNKSVDTKNEQEVLEWFSFYKHSKEPVVAQHFCGLTCASRFISKKWAAQPLPLSNTEKVIAQHNSDGVLGHEHRISG